MPRKTELTATEFLELGRLLRTRRNEALDVQTTIGNAVPMTSPAWRAAEKLVKAFDVLRSALENEAAKAHGDDFALCVWAGRQQT